MESENPILNATIEVKGNRIVAIHNDTVVIPADATSFDVQNGWAMPGLVDAHAHWDTAWSAEYKVKNSWDLLANLAYGM